MANKIKSGLAIALVLCLPAPASAETSAPAAARPAPVPIDDGTINIVAQKLCQAEPIIGTRIAFKRKCDTPRQLQQYRQQAREIIEQYRQRPCVAGTGGGENDVVVGC